MSIMDMISALQGRGREQRRAPDVSMSSRTFGVLSPLVHASVSVGTHRHHFHATATEEGVDAACARRARGETVDDLEAGSGPALSTTPKKRASAKMMGKQSSSPFDSDGDSESGSDGGGVGGGGADGSDGEDDGPQTVFHAPDEAGVVQFLCCQCRTVLRVRGTAAKPPACSGLFHHFHLLNGDDAVGDEAWSEWRCCVCEYSLQVQKRPGTVGMTYHDRILEDSIMKAEGMYGAHTEAFNFNKTKPSEDALACISKYVRQALEGAWIEQDAPVDGDGGSDNGSADGRQRRLGDILVTSEEFGDSLGYMQYEPLFVEALGYSYDEATFTLVPPDMGVGEGLANASYRRLVRCLIDIEFQLDRLQNIGLRNLSVLNGGGPISDPSEADEFVRAIFGADYVPIRDGGGVTGGLRQINGMLVRTQPSETVLVAYETLGVPADVDDAAVVYAVNLAVHDEPERSLAVLNALSIVARLRASRALLQLHQTMMGDAATNDPAIAEETASYRLLSVDPMDTDNTIVEMYCALALSVEGPRRQAFDAALRVLAKRRQSQVLQELVITFQVQSDDDEDDNDDNDGEGDTIGMGGDAIGVDGDVDGAGMDAGPETVGEAASPTAGAIDVPVSRAVEEAGGGGGAGGILSPRSPLSWIPNFSKAKKKPDVHGEGMPVGLSANVASPHANALLQALFHTPSFRALVLAWRGEGGSGSLVKVMNHLQSLFALLVMGDCKACRADGLVTALARAAHRDGGEPRGLGGTRLLSTPETFLDNLLSIAATGFATDPSVEDTALAALLTGERETVDRDLEEFSFLSINTSQDSVADAIATCLAEESGSEAAIVRLPAVLTCVLAPPSSEASATRVLKAFVSGEPLLVDRFLAANVDAVDSVSRAVAEIKHRRSVAREHVSACVAEYAGTGLTEAQIVGHALAIATREGSTEAEQSLLAVAEALAAKQATFESEVAAANDELAALWAGQALDKVAYVPHAAVVSDSGGSGGSGGLAPARHWVYLRDHKADRWLAFDDDEITEIAPGDVPRDLPSSAAVVCLMYLSPEEAAAAAGRSWADDVDVVPEALRHRLERTNGALAASIAAWEGEGDPFAVALESAGLGQ